MATIKLVVLPAKQLKSGKHKVRIAVSQSQETSYIVTRFKIDNVNQFKNGQVVGRSDASHMNRKLFNLLNDYYEVLDTIRPDNYTAKQLKTFLQNNVRSGSISISKAADEHISKLKKDNTKKLYERTKDYFISAFGDVPLDMITPLTISNFDEYLEDKGNNSTSRAMHLRHLRAFINRQIKKGSITYQVSPFYNIQLPESQERELDLTVTELKLIRDAQFKEKPLRCARDLFMLSYYLGGINLIDLLEIDFRNAVTIDYVREKSRLTKRGEKRVSLTIPPEAKHIIKTWIGSNGKLNFGYNYKYEYLRNYITKQISRLARKLGINKRVVYYSARKSLVQHGFELGISLEVLEYSIGQSVKKNRPIFNYVRIMRSHADAAMRIILDNLKKKRHYTTKKKLFSCKVKRKK